MSNFRWQVGNGCDCTNFCDEVGMSCTPVFEASDLQGQRKYIEYLYSVADSKRMTASKIPLNVKYVRQRPADWKDNFDLLNDKGNGGIVSVPVGYDRWSWHSSFIDYIEEIPFFLNRDIDTDYKQIADAIEGSECKAIYSVCADSSSIRGYYNHPHSVRIGFRVSNIPLSQYAKIYTVGDFDRGLMTVLDIEYPNEFIMTEEVPIESYGLIPWFSMVSVRFPDEFIGSMTGINGAFEKDDLDDLDNILDSYQLRDEHNPHENFAYFKNHYGVSVNQTDDIIIRPYLVSGSSSIVIPKQLTRRIMSIQKFRGEYYAKRSQSGFKFVYDEELARQEYEKAIANIPSIENTVGRFSITVNAAREYYKDCDYADASNAGGL